jgi:hypothetical protein
MAGERTSYSTTNTEFRYRCISSRLTSPSPEIQMCRPHKRPQSRVSALLRWERHSTRHPQTHSPHQPPTRSPLVSYWSNTMRALSTGVPMHSADRPAISSWMLKEPLPFRSNSSKSLPHPPTQAHGHMPARLLHSINSTHALSPTHTPNTRPADAASPNRTCCTAPWTTLGCPPHPRAGPCTFADPPR